MRPTFEELVQYREGEVTQARAQQIERELQQDEALRAELGKVDELVGALQQPDPALANVDLRQGIAAALETPSARPARRWPMVAGALALAASVAVGVFAVATREDPVAVKGGAFVPCGLEIFLHDGTRAPSTIGPDEALGFAYRNLDQSPYGWLMIYAVTSTGEIVWYYPEWTDPGESPRSIATRRSAAPIGLPESVRHDLPEGRLVVHALFTRAPWTTTQLEDAVKRGQLPAAPEVRDLEYELTVKR